MNYANSEQLAYNIEDNQQLAYAIEDNQKRSIPIWALHLAHTVGGVCVCGRLLLQNGLGTKGLQVPGVVTPTEMSRRGAKRRRKGGLEGWDGLGER